jgi:pilus assembly protein FimV
MNAQPASAGVDLDFDLDFSLDDDNAQVITEMSSPDNTAKIQAVAGAEPSLDMNFDLPTEATQSLASSAPTKPGVIEFDLPALGELSKSGEVSGPVPLDDSPLTIPFTEEADEFKKEAALSFGATQSGVPLKAVDGNGAISADAVVTAAGALEFDIGNLSLEIGNSVLPADSSAAGAAEPEADPLATKLALAEEFNSIGDTDGARALIEEVIAEASGDLKARAQKALAALA